MRAQLFIPHPKLAAYTSVYRLRQIWSNNLTLVGATGARVIWRAQ